MMEMVGQRRDHRRAQHMRDVAHHRIGAPALDEGPQLSLDIFRLLSRKPRHREISEVALARQSMAGLAIFKLGFEAASRAGVILSCAWPLEEKAIIRIAVGNASLKQIRFTIRPLRLPPDVSASTERAATITNRAPRYES